ncbi:hypothetical protein AWM70_06950 [Paenibacillus yonginensis]|uniref:N-acetyltransferase domain-containing protein n=1 Tax=Paenibacillus yonginensis TaxID=1462996 RepID=A0A1B1MYT8_9BACL|nr:GNAT family N-acetyltransferase [Paenibacillus yonginensis]ANS74352.1 hypothetical protein AWM70_06950 [Paenibacillus yonginensis]
MDLSFTTLSHWDQNKWNQLKPIYEEAFPHGAKPEPILRGMLDRKIGFLHGGYKEEEAAAMAVTGLVGQAGERKLILDYMAIRQDLRGQGLGKLFLNQIRDWAVREHNIQAIILEAEAEDNEINQARLQFWRRCGFIPTDYVHTYIWVPEPYRALVLPLKPGFERRDDGESLFRCITALHEQAYRKR